MATKYVRETKAGKSIRALVILNKKGQHVATLQASFSDNPAGSVCLVNVWHTGPDHIEMQHARAGGYGYDKFSSALAGMTIDGHAMTDHCGARLKYPKGLDHFPRDFKAPKGYRVANYRKDADGYSDCYRLPGLEYLTAIGYRIIEAI